MIKRSEYLRLAMKACEPFGISREHLRQHFERDVATELCVSRSVDLSHAACTDGRDDFVRPEACSDGWTHFVPAGFQFWISVIGLAASSTTVLIRKRPSGE